MRRVHSAGTIRAIGAPAASGAGVVRLADAMAAFTMAFALHSAYAAPPASASASGSASASANADIHRFAVIGNSFARANGEARLKQALADSSEATLAFVFVTGIKSATEPCSDKLYEQRRDLLDEAKRPVIVAPAAADWSECKNAGRSIAAERLARWREVFASAPQSLGTHKLPLNRQSSSAKFRSYAENAHWEVDNVLYATVNLPADNNHYRPEAGRNSEFEDRLVANRFWLHRLFALARSDKLRALVLMSEGDVKALSQPTGLRALLGSRANGPRDGYDEPRRQIAALAAKFSGKVLLIDTAAPDAGAPAIVWRGNLGHLSLGSKAVEVRVTPAATTGPTMFVVSNPAQTP
jgi:hypothetical protein